jgi:hypothetical protein
MQRRSWWCIARAFASRGDAQANGSTLTAFDVLLVQLRDTILPTFNRRWHCCGGNIVVGSTP